MSHVICPRPARAGRPAARWACAALALATALAWPGAAQGQTQAQAQAQDAVRLASAQAEYEIGHYGAAFDLFAALADDGHCEAARVARAMLRYGRLLYGVAFDAGGERAARWRAAETCVAMAAAAAASAR